MKPHRIVVSGVVLAVLGAASACTADPVVVPAPMVSATAAPSPPDRPTRIVTSVAGVHPGFPRRRISMSTNARTLPADRAVGAAALVIRDPDFRTHLVMPDGTQWDVPVPTDSSGIALSPDGRLLAYSTARGFVIRDLMGTATTVLPRLSGVGSARAWSPNGRWLLGQTGDNGKVPLLDLTTGRVTDLPATEDIDGEPTDTGTVLRGTCADWTGQVLTMRSVDRADRARPRSVTFNAAPYLRAGEQVVRVPTGGAVEDHAPECLFRRGAGDDAYLAVYETPTKRDFGWLDVTTVRSFLVVSARTGRFVRRVDLSVPYDTSAGLILDYFDGGLLVHQSATGPAGILDHPADLIRLDLVTGRRSLVTRFAAGVWPVLAGLT
jgi:hypothetical protein